MLRDHNLCFAFRSLSRIEPGRGRGALTEDPGVVARGAAWPGRAYALWRMPTGPETYRPPAHMCSPGDDCSLAAGTLILLLK